MSAPLSEDSEVADAAPVPGFIVDPSRAPLLFVRFDGVVDDVAFASYLGQIRAFVDRGLRYAIVFDASTAGVPTAAQRRMQTDQMRNDFTRIQSLCVGGAFVIPSPLVRGGLTAMLWVQPLPFPHKLVADLPSAEVWCRAQLAKPSVS